MIWLYCILGYIVIPFIIFPINNWFAGYYEDRMKETCLNLYDNKDEIWILHLVWPLIFIVLIVKWSVELYKIKFKEYPKVNWGYTYKKGKAKRKQDTDLDYQAEKYLLGKKDGK